MTKYDVILVPGIGFSRAYNYRVNKAVALYKNGVASKVLFSGRFFGGSSRKPKNTEAEIMAQYARTKGLPASAILLERKSLNTIGNFYFSKLQFIRPRRWKRILVVTHRNHFPKAKYIVKKVFGKKYKIHFIEDSPKVFPVLKEHNTLVNFKKYYKLFVDTKDGDDRKIGLYLKTLPFYKKYS